MSLSTGGGFARKDALLHAPVIFLLLFLTFFPTPRGAVESVLLLMP